MSPILLALGKPLLVLVGLVGVRYTAPLDFPEPADNPGVDIRENLDRAENPNFIEIVPAEVEVEPDADEAKAKTTPEP